MGMPRKRSSTLTSLELRIMRVLWSQQGPATVQTVVDGLTEQPRLAYTTVQTTLNVLERKKQVRRKLIGRAYEYSPVVTEEAAGAHAITEVLQKVFRGSVEDLLMSLVRGKHLSPGKLARLEAMLSKAKSTREGK